MIIITRRRLVALLACWHMEQRTVCTKRGKVPVVERKTVWWIVCSLGATDTAAERLNSDHFPEPRRLYRQARALVRYIPRLFGAPWLARCAVPIILVGSLVPFDRLPWAISDKDGRYCRHRYDPGRGTEEEKKKRRKRARCKNASCTSTSCIIDVLLLLSDFPVGVGCGPVHTKHMKRRRHGA